MSGADEDADNDDDPPKAARHAPPLQPKLIADEWREAIARYLERRQQVTVTEVIEAVQADGASTAAQRRVTEIMRDLRWTPQRDKHGRWWQRGDSTGDTITRSAVTNGVTTDRNGVTTDDAHRVAACAIPSPVKRST